MKKTIITGRNVKEFADKCDGVLVIDKSMILTPSAADYLKSRGIDISYGNEVHCSNEQTFGCSDLADRIKRMLINDFGIENPAWQQAVIKAVEAKVKK